MLSRDSPVPKSKFFTHAHMCVRKQPETLPYFVIRLRRRKLRRQQLVPRHVLNPKKKVSLKAKWFNELREPLTSHFIR